MSKALITEGYLTDIANAIRAKNGSRDTYTPPQMAAAIAAIPTGSDVDVEPLNVTQNGTYTAPSGKAYSPVTALVPNTYGSGDEGKVVQNGALVAQTSRTLTQNGTYDTTTNDSVTVNVSGGGGGNITYGTDSPAASAGSDGDVYFKYEVYSGYNSLLPSEDANLNNWSKNTAAFTQFDNTYNAGENTLIQTGGNGYERIYVPIAITQNTDYVFGLKYYSPSGVAGGYNGQLAFGISYASESTMHASSAISLTSKTNLSLTADSSYSDYSLSFNSGSNTSVYLVIDLNILDSNQCTLKFKDIVFYKSGEPPVAVDGNIIRKAYLKQSSAWVDAIGAIID